jgi:hypothetical protein
MAAGRTSSRSRIDPPLCDEAAGVRSLSGSPSCWDLAARKGVWVGIASQPLLRPFRAKLVTV